MSAYPGYMDDIPEPDAAYYEQISGGFDDSIYCEQVIISPIGEKSAIADKPPRPQNQAIYKIDAFDILSRASAELSALSANCGIDWQVLNGLLNSTQTEYKSNAIALDKSYRGKVKAWFEIKTAKNGQQYPVLTFHSLKHGGVSEQFNGYQWAKDNGLFDNKPLTAEQKNALERKRAERDQQQAKKAEQAKQQQANTQEQTIKRFNDFQKLFDSLPQLTDTKETYLELKGFTAENFSSDFLSNSGLILKRGQDKDGSFIAYALKNNHKTVGYQKLYDKPVTWLNGNKQSVFLPESKNGSFAMLGKPQNLTDKIYLVEGFATGLSVHTATGKPVIIALDAGNLFHVAESQSKIFKSLTIAADNDIKALGNTGLYNALTTAKAFNLDIAYPVLASGEKCDFNDLHVKHGLKEVKSQLKSNKLDFSESSIYYNLLLNYCPVQNKANLEKHLKSACFIAANQLLLNNADDIKNAALSIQTILDNRKLSFNAESQIKWFLDKKLFEIKKANSLVNLENIDVHNCTGKNNAELAQLIRQHKKSIWIDPRPMGTGKTELMQVIADAVKSKKGIDTQITYIAHRTALIKDASNRLSLRYYEDVQWYNGERPSTLATTANSILNHAVSDYVKILFIDEIRQTLEHILNGTCDNRLEVFNQLIAAIKNADLVICADADMNQFTLDWLKSIANKPLRMIASDTLKLDKKIIELDTNGALFGKIREDLLSGKNAWITTDSMSKARNIGEFLTLEDDSDISTQLKSLFNDDGLNLKVDDVLLVTSENKADIKQALFLANPNEESKKYRVIIHTPVISSGVSVTNGHFNSVYAVFCNVTAPNEMLQTLARVRTAKTIYCTFKTGHIKNRATNIKDLIDGETIKRSRFNKESLKLDYFDNLRLNQIVNKNHALNDFKPYFFLLAGQKGYDVLPFQKTNDIDSESEKQLTDNLKKISSIVKQKVINSVLTAEIIDGNEAIKIEKLNAATQQQSNALKRYKVCQWTGKDSKENALNDITELDIDFVVFNKGSSIIANYELLEANLEDLKQSDNDNFSFRDKLASKTSKHLLFKTVIDGINGLKDGLFDSATAGKICEFLRDHHKELASNGLGNYAKVSRYPVKQLTEFLSKCGYDVLKVTQNDNGTRWYSIAPNEQVKSYADARAYQRKLKNIDTDM